LFSLLAVEVARAVDYSVDGLVLGSSHSATALES
jgi:hypothetical protein